MTTPTPVPTPPPTRFRRHTHEPGRWALFAAGGQIAALVVPALVVVLGLLIPLGALGDADAVHARLHGFFTHPLGSGLVFAVLGLILWHCIHRIIHGLHDLQVSCPKWARNIMYLFTVLAPLTGWMVGRV